MKTLLLGMAVVLGMGGLAVADDIAYYTDEPKNVVTLNSANGFSFTEEYSWLNETGGQAEILGSWASHAWSYGNACQNASFSNTLNLAADPCGWLRYQVVVDAPMADVTVSAPIRRGLTVRISPNETSSFYDHPVLFQNGGAWVEGSGVVPANLLDTSVPGQVSFMIQIMNESSDFAGGIDSLHISAVPREVTTTPTFNPDGGTYYAPQNVTITCAADGATIRYTTDGSEPTETNGFEIASGDSVVVDHTMTLKARAWVNGIDPSAIKSADYGICIYTDEPKHVVTLAQTGPEEYSFTEEYSWLNETGGHGEILGSWASHAWSYTNVLQYAGYSNTLNLSNNPRGALVYQFIVPVPMAQVTVEAAIRRGIVVRARVNELASFNDYPNLFANGGEWVTGSAVLPVSLLDTSVPGQVSFMLQIMNEASDFAGGIDSLRISAVPQEVAATPTFSPDGGTFYTPQNVTISCATAGATIRYTTDGSEPTETNGFEIASGATVFVNHTMILKARAWAAGIEASGIKVALFTIPTTYSRPVTIKSTPADCVTVDGLLIEWADAQWAPLDQDYMNVAADVTAASYAARWADDGTKIYVAIRVRDTNHTFSDGYSSWNGQDCVEIYLHTTGIDGIEYNASQEKAQQYVIGFNPAGAGVWTAMGNTQAVPARAGFEAAGTLGADGWLYYEAALTPFASFGAFTGGSDVVSTLHVDDVIGLDVIVDSRDGDAFAMRSENMLDGKWNNYMQFGLHRLIAGPVVTPIPTPTLTPTPSPVPGDANRDNTVNFVDFSILQNNYGQSGKTWYQGDFTADGWVTFEDFSILQNHYGQSGGMHSSAAAEADGVLATAPCGMVGLLFLALVGLSLLFLRRPE